MKNRMESMKSDGYLLHDFKYYTLEWYTVFSSVASLTINSRYANIFVFIDCENNQFLKK